MTMSEHDKHERHDERALVENHPVRDSRAGLPAGPPITEELAHLHNDAVADRHDNDAAGRTLWGDAWRRLRRNRLALIALIWLVLMVTAAVSADLWVSKLFGDPATINSATAMSNRLLSPTLAHPLGTDTMGRDMLGRLIYGARASLTVGLSAVVISVVIGLLLGALSGFYPGITDSLIMRMTDIFLAFPYILFCILILAMLPTSARGIGPVILSIGLLGWPSFARLFRGSVLSVKENDYVDAGRAIGASDSRLMFRHIMPNAIAPVIVYATMSIGGAILTEAALSFLGLGIQPPEISWGRMITDGQRLMDTNPGLVFWPGLMIILTVVSFTLLGDGLRDALDVKMKD
jgi:peptide/nickel transport system permease protein/oligopeptide transport system permease protein